MFIPVSNDKGNCTYYFISDPADQLNESIWKRDDNRWTCVGHNRYKKVGGDNTVYTPHNVRGSWKEEMQPVRSSSRHPSPTPTPLPSIGSFNVNSRAKPNPSSTEVVVASPLKGVVDQRKQAGSLTKYIKDSSRVGLDTPGRTVVARGSNLFKVTIDQNDMQKRTPQKPSTTIVKTVFPTPPGKTEKRQKKILIPGTVPSNRVSQNQVMNGWSAQAYAIAVQYPGAHNLRWEWLHLIACSAGGLNAPDNFVAGSFDANTLMIPFEQGVLGLAKKLEKNEQIEYEVKAKLWNGTHVAESIHLSAVLPKRLCSSGEKFNVEISASSNKAASRAVIDILKRALSESIDQQVTGSFGQ